MDIVTLLILVLSSGTVSGVIMYLINKRNTDAITDITVDKALAEIKTIEQTIEENYILQLKDWIKELKTIEVKHRSELAAKDDELVELHRSYLETVKQLTESKLTLDKIHKATQHLMSQLNVPYWECNAEGTLLYINNAWADLFGINPHYSNWIESFIESERNAVRMLWDVSEINIASHPPRFHIINPVSGKQIPIRLIYSHIKDENGKLIKVIGVIIKLRVD